MGRAITMEAKIDALEAQIKILKDNVSLIERAIQAGKKKPATKKTKPKKDTLLEVIKEADNE